MKYCYTKKKYFVHMSKFVYVRGGFRNFEVCKTYAHALRIYRNCKVKLRQIDVIEYRKPSVAIRWGRK